MINIDIKNEPNNTYQGSFFKLVRGFFRLIRRRVSTPPAAEFTAPAVYIGHHQNLKGPFNTMVWLRVPVRLWVLNVFSDREKCRRQYADYTFREHYKFPKFIAQSLAGIASAPIAKLMRSMGAIEVYRKTEAAKAIKTFRASVDALTQGERVLIFPDVEYDSGDSSMGEIYKGFLYLEKYYFAKTNRHLPFIPIRYSETNSSITLGKPVTFGDGNVDDQIDAISAELVDRINKLNEG